MTSRDDATGTVTRRHGPRPTVVYDEVQFLLQISNFMCRGF